jgi:hypothetical protein
MFREIRDRPHSQPAPRSRWIRQAWAGLVALFDRVNGSEPRVTLHARDYETSLVVTYT